MTDCQVLVHLSITKRFELTTSFCFWGCRLPLGVPTIVYLILFACLCQYFSWILLPFPVDELCDWSVFRELGFGIVYQHLRILPPACGL